MTKLVGIALEDTFLLYGKQIISKIVHSNIIVRPVFCCKVCNFFSNKSSVILYANRYKMYSMLSLYWIRVYNWKWHLYQRAKYLIYDLFKEKQFLKLGLKFFCNRFLQILSPECHFQIIILASKIKPKDSLYIFLKKKKQTHCRNWYSN